jgi:hypothetical protein
MKRVGMAEAAREAGLPRSTVYARLYRGWSPEAAVGRTKLPSAGFRHLLTDAERLAYDNIRRCASRDDPVKARNEALRAIGRSDLVRT